MKPSTVREPLKLSTLPAHRINLRDGERRSVVCPDCEAWHPIRRGKIWPHHLDSTERGHRAPRCPGSGRRIEMDLDIKRWARKAAEADASAAGRRAERAVRKPRPQPAPALHQMAPTVRQLRAALEEHSFKRCLHCRAGNCRTAAELRARIRRVAQPEPPAPRYAQLRTALMQHRADCTACKAGKPCVPARRLADRMADLVQGRTRSTRPDLCR
ncbi:hypothetical protein ACFU99_27175 [Streptomyces sp. NPDC057654]|uniref:hypothetical protein n=1 Tax=Streptomyces sp. NPDC057654 TaxID=3346196 RepID=UPI00368FE95E